MTQQTRDVRESYDQVADEYVTRIAHELEYKPLDRELLTRLVQEVDHSYRTYDLGCGPGHVTRYLHEQGASVAGIDLSPRMIDQARNLNPGIDFQQGDMAALSLQTESCAGLVSFYSLIHFPREQIVQVLQEFRRVLRPGGLLLMAFHLGQEIRHMEEWWNRQVHLDFVFFARSEMEEYLRAAGFQVEEVIERSPYPDVETQTRRAYIFARK